MLVYRIHQVWFFYCLKMNQRSETFQHLSNNDRACWECHREVPHGRVRSLSSVPNARIPLPPSPIPDWLQKALK
jgi:cytochrome c nitrite reductase small subunit